jgi:hypothetical protein
VVEPDQARQAEQQRGIDTPRLADVAHHVLDQLRRVTLAAASVFGGDDPTQSSEMKRKTFCPDVMPENSDARNSG